MKNYLKNSIILFTLLAFLMWSTPVHAVNTHSADFELDSAQYYSAADSASLDITGDLTIEVWTKVESITGSWRTVVFKDNENNRSYAMVLRDVAGTNQIGILIASDGSDLVNKFNNADPLDDGEWHHIAFAYDASAGSAEFFYDGLSVGTQTGLPNSIFSGNGLLRSSNYVPGDYFDGLLDELRVWNDIRTDAEIDDNKCLELVGDEAGLVAYYQFNDSLLDETANNNDLTNNNSFVFTTTDAFESPLCDVAVITPITPPTFIIFE